MAIYRCRIIIIIIIKYLDEHVLVNDFSVEHVLRQIAHQRVKLVRVLRRRQPTKITFHTEAVTDRNIRFAYETAVILPRVGNAVIGGLGRLALAGGPVGPPSRWAATSNVRSRSDDLSR